MERRCRISSHTDASPDLSGGNPGADECRKEGSRNLMGEQAFFSAWGSRNRLNDTKKSQIINTNLTGRK
jgi:hypothetical protein